MKKAKKSDYDAHLLTTQEQYDRVRACWIQWKKHTAEIFGDLRRLRKLLDVEKKKNG